MKLALLSLALAGCAARSPASTAPASPAIADPHSYARAERLVVTHLALDLTVDFARKQLAGTAALDLARRAPGSELVLDTDHLTITAVHACGGAQALPFTVGAVHPILGAPLTIQVPPSVTCVAVQYHTAPDAKALLWVDPAGTAGKAQPMLFTQSEAILGRSWVPMQDTPSVRFTYDATIRVPPQLLALMSADNPDKKAADGVYTFHMQRAIPSYLMALAVGDFVHQPIGTRTGVYAEPSVAKAAASEFAEVDAMVATAEKLYGAYRWNRYDMLVLPPSFPYGGMENPRLTFLTPTAITGDRAMVSLIAHELAHSWAGNLVTNATWNDTWLNEGITTYVERRIMEALRGKEFADLLWHLGRVDLDKAIAELGGTPASRLHQTLDASGDPDSVSSDIAYEKGALFMRALELRVGRDRFDAFLKDRFDRLAFQSTDSQRFEADTLAHLGEALRPMIEAWVFAPGLPADAPPDTSALASKIAAEARAYAASGAAFDTTGWKSLEWISFLRSLPASTTIERLRELDARYHWTGSPNNGVAMYWYPLLIERDERAAVPAIDHFLASVGRRFMVREVYAALVKKGGFWLDHGRQVFATVGPTYHPVTRSTIADMLAGKT